MSNYPQNFNGAAFDARYGTDDDDHTPTITQPIGYESVTDHPDPNIHNGRDGVGRRLWVLLP